MSHSLKDLQSWFQTVITHPDGVRAGVSSVEAVSTSNTVQSDVERVILPSNEMSSFDRLQIYGSAYFGRLIECLGVQFPAVRHAVGDNSFNAFAYGYLIQNPSTSYSLASLGRTFPEFLNATRPSRDPLLEGRPDFADLVVDLALLEKTYSEVFDGPGPESVQPMQPEEFAGLDAERFARCRLVMFDCVRLLTLRFPAHKYTTALRQGLEPEMPAPQTTHLVITRRDYVVRRFEITEHQSHLLTLLKQNATIGDALTTLFSVRAGLDSNLDSSTIQKDLMLWFSEWTAAPLFSRLVTRPELT